MAPTLGWPTVPAIRATSAPARWESWVSSRMVTPMSAAAGAAEPRRRAAVASASAGSWSPPPGKTRTYRAPRSRASFSSSASSAETASSSPSAATWTYPATVRISTPAALNASTTSARSREESPGCTGSSGWARSSTPWYPWSAASRTTSGSGRPGTPSVEKASFTCASFRRRRAGSPAPFPGSCPPPGTLCGAPQHLLQATEQPQRVLPFGGLQRTRRRGRGHRFRGDHPQGRRRLPGEHRQQVQLPHAAPGLR